MLYSKQIFQKCLKGAFHWNHAHLTNDKYWIIQNKNPVFRQDFLFLPHVGLEPTMRTVKNIVALLGALRNARCFFLLRAPLHLPQAARCSEPVNSRCGCVWQGRRFGSASKVKKSRKTGVSLALFAKCDCYFNSWSVCVANIKRQLRCHEVRTLCFSCGLSRFISEAPSFFMHRRCA